MEQLLVTVEDVKNELDINLASELDMQPKQIDKWLMRQQLTILSYIAGTVNGDMGKVELMLKDESKAKAVRAAIIEQINYIAGNNFVQPNKVMNIDGQQVVEPTIAPLAHQMLLNSGLLRTAE